MKANFTVLIQKLKIKNSCVLISPCGFPSLTKNSICFRLPFKALPVLVFPCLSSSFSFLCLRQATSLWFPEYPALCLSLLPVCGPPGTLCLLPLQVLSPWAPLPKHVKRQPGWMSCSSPKMCQVVSSLLASVHPQSGIFFLPCTLFNKSPVNIHLSQNSLLTLLLTFFLKPPHEGACSPLVIQPFHAETSIIAFENIAAMCFHVYRDLREGILLFRFVLLLPTPSIFLAHDRGLINV